MNNTSDVFDTSETQNEFKVFTEFDDYARRVYLDKGKKASLYFDDGSVKLESGCFDLILSAEEMKVLIQQYANFPSTSEWQHLHCASFY
jgi:hypothetical protein